MSSESSGSQNRFFFICPVTEEMSEDLIAETYFVLAGSRAWYSKEGLKQLKGEGPAFEVLMEIAGGFIVEIDRSSF